MEWERQKMIAFIEMYKLKPNLWDNKNKYYKDRNMRHDALMEIANEFNIEKPAVEQKIRNIQSQLAREVRKVKDSHKKSGSGMDVYRSKWFAYESLRFLRDRWKPRETLVSEGQQFADQDPADESSGHSSFTYEMSNQTQFKQEPSTSNSANNDEFSVATTQIKPNIKKQRKIIDKNEEYLDNSSLLNLEEWEIIGKSIGVQLKTLNSHQAIIAQKLIADILFNAKLGRLCEESTISLRPHSPSFYQTQSPSPLCRYSKSSDSEAE